MNATYVCWQSPEGGEWTVYKIGPDGSREAVKSFTRYLDAARLIQSLRQHAETIQIIAAKTTAGSGIGLPG